MFQITCSKKAGHDSTTQFYMFSHINLTIFLKKTLPSFAGNGTNLSFLVKVKCCKIIFKKRTKNRAKIGELTVCLLQVKTASVFKIIKYNCRIQINFN